MELIKIFEQTTGTKIPVVWTGRRVGDVDTLVCRADLANEELGWVPQFDVVRMCKFPLALCSDNVVSTFFLS